MFFVAAFRANAVLIQCNAAKRATINFVVCLEFCGGRIDAAGKGKLCNIQLVLQQIVHNFNHTLDGHGFCCDNETTVWVCGGKFRLEGCALHLVLGMTIFNALFLIHIQDGGQQRAILSQNQRMVKIFEYIPSGFLNFITGENHVYTIINRILHLDGQYACMSM